MIDAITILGMGFSQDQRLVTGQEMLWEQLNDEFGKDPQWFGLWPVPWDHDAKGLAARIDRRLLKPGGRIVLGMYSWSSRLGTDLADALADYGRSVTALILCAPVYRSKVIGWRYIAWTLKHPKIVIPSNVEYAVSFRSKVADLADHEIVPEKESKPLIGKPVWLDLPHGMMDEAPEYHQSVIDWTRRAIGMAT